MMNNRKNLCEIKPFKKDCSMIKYYKSNYNDKSLSRFLLAPDFYNVTNEYKTCVFAYLCLNEIYSYYNL